MMMRKSDLLNDGVTSAASTALVTATVLQRAQQLPATPVYIGVVCTAAGLVSS